MSGVLPLTHHTQGLGHGAFARREDGPHKQDVHVLAYGPGEQWRKCYHQGDKLAGHVQLGRWHAGGCGVEVEGGRVLIRG